MISMKNLQQKEKLKLAKGFEKRIAKGKMEQAAAECYSS